MGVMSAEGRPLLSDFTFETGPVGEPETVNEISAIDLDEARDIFEDVLDKTVFPPIPYRLVVMNGKETLQEFVWTGEPDD